MRAIDIPCSYTLEAASDEELVAAAHLTSLRRPRPSTRGPGEVSGGQLAMLSRGGRLPEGGSGQSPVPARAGQSSGAGASGAFPAPAITGPS